MKDCERCDQPLNDRKASNTIQFHSVCLAGFLVLLVVLSGCAETGNVTLDQILKVTGQLREAPVPPPPPVVVPDQNVSGEMLAAVGLNSDGCSIEWTNICYNFPTGLGTDTFHWCSNEDCGRAYTCDDKCPIGTSCKIFESQNLCVKG